MQYYNDINCEITQWKGEKKLPEVQVENLEAEMKRKKISRRDIARILGLSYRTIHSRFNGESEWGYSECVLIRDTYFPDMELSYLFQTVKQDFAEEPEKEV